MLSTELYLLLGIQMALGTFDIFYHHEFSERLAWRPGQDKELRLHAARNFSYALLFLTLAWFVPYGCWALALIVLLAAEVVITLSDFVEEDRSRLLPWTERIIHAVLAINFGAILSVLVPALIAHTAQPTTLVISDQGYPAYLLTLCAIVVGLLGGRDLAAARRLSNCRKPPLTRLAAKKTAKPQRILITGASGLIGSRLVTALQTAGHRIIVLTRDARNASHLPAPLTILTGLGQLDDDETIDAVINLAGEPIANGLWTRHKRQRIVQSRQQTTIAINQLIKRLKQKPEVLINASAIGWYGLRADELLDENADSKPCFSHTVCQTWEQLALQAQAYGVRVVRLRIGLVLSTRGGFLAQLLPVFEYGLGGPVGDGRQWLSWITLDDLVRLIRHTLLSPALEGPLNATAPEPVRNIEFSRALAATLNRPALFRLPAAPLRCLGGDLARELLLGGQRVIPAKALASGFRFRHPTLKAALRAVVERID